MVFSLNWNKLIDFLTKILLILSFSFALAITINAFISYKFFDLNKSVKLKRIQQKKEKQLNYSYINYIFQKFQPIKVEKVTKEGKNTIQVTPEELNLKIKLIGTAISYKEKVAFIQDKEGLKIIKPGDKLGKFKVKTIDRYSITLTDGTNNYYIPLTIGSSSNLKASRRSYSEIPKPRAVSQPQESNHYEISKREVEKQTADLGKLLRYVRIVPVVKNGETKGYKFAYVSPRSILYKYGLRSGDIIVSVNGMPVRTAEEAFKIYNMLRNEKNIRLEVERRGERKVITYEIK